MPAVERRRGAKNGAFARELQRGVEWRLWLAVEHIGAGGIDIGEVGAERPPQRVDDAVRGDHQVEKADRRSRQHGERNEPHALARQPGAASGEIEHCNHEYSEVGIV